MDSHYELSSYKRYKSDTSTFLCWLTQTAKSCGYSLPRSSRSFEDKHKHGIPLKYLSKMANVVVANAKPSLQIPRSMVAIGHRAIRLRRHVSERWAGLGFGTGASASDLTHKHFTDTLERIMNKLERGAITSRSKTKTVHDVSAYLAEPSLYSCLEALEIDVPVPPPSVHESGHLAQNVAGDGDAEQKFEVEDNSETELDHIGLMIELIFHMHELKRHVIGVWKEYQISKVDLSTAALISDAAICLVEEKQKEVAETLAIPEMDLWAKLVKRLRPTQETLPNHGPEEAQFSDFIFEDIYAVLHQQEIACFQDRKSDSRRDGFIRGYDGTASLWVLPGTDATYREAQDQYHLQGTYEEKLLQYLLIEVDLAYMILQRLGNTRADVLTKADGLTRAFAYGFDHGVSPSMVFAAAVVVQVNIALGQDIDKAYGELMLYQKECKAQLEKRIKKKLDYYSEPGHWHVIESRSLGDADYLVSSYENCPFLNTEIEYPALSKQSSMEEAGGNIMTHNDNRYFFYKHNPLFCGMRKLCLMLAMEDGAVRLANNHLSILTTAHLYHSLKQNGLLSLDWPRLEAAIKIHEGTFFFGEAPTNPGLALKVYQLRFGQSLSKYHGLGRRHRESPVTIFESPDARSRKHRASPYCLATTKTSQALHQYIHGEETLVRTVHALKTDAEKVYEKHRGQRNNVNPSGQHRESDAVATLVKLRPWLEDNFRSMAFDYIALSDKCDALLTTLVNSKLVRHDFSFDKMICTLTKDGKMTSDPQFEAVALSAFKKLVSRYSLVGVVLEQIKEKEDFKQSKPFKRRKNIVLPPSDGDKIAPYVQKWLEIFVHGPRKRRELSERAHVQISVG